MAVSLGGAFLLLFAAFIFINRNKFFSEEVQKMSQENAKNEIFASSKKDEASGKNIGNDSKVGFSEIQQTDDQSFSSENYKIRQISFGGDPALAYEDSEKLPIEISKVMNDSYLSQDKDDEMKIVISWKTNKLTLSEIDYSRSNGQDLRKVSEDSYGFNHSMVLSGLEPGTLYVYKIIAKDRSGNQTSSDYFGVYTKPKSTSIIDVIKNNFDEIFGWAMD